MPYQATVIPIMIASPGDVFEERKAIRDTIYNWNHINSAKEKIVLAPTGWETHSSPELGTRGQELINIRVLKECDLLIGVFWTKLGTPTGKSKSGTVEEIEEHVKLGKPAMIYFSSKPVPQESIDPEQHSALTTFKKYCEAQGLIDKFNTITDLKSKISSHLSLCLNKNEYLQSILSKHTSIFEKMGTTETDLSPNLGNISEEAQTLLSAAAGRHDGVILMAVTLGGRHIQTGGRSFGGKRGGRESARWEHALNELLDKNLIVARGHKGELFELTHEGWKLADELKKQNNI